MKAELIKLHKVVQKVQSAFNAALMQEPAGDLEELDVRKTHGDQRIENPKTGNDIKLRTALKAKKGSQVYLEGQVRTRKYTDQAGAEKSTTEIVLQGYNCHLTMLDGRSSDDTQTVTSPNVENSKIDKRVDQEIEEFDIEDEVPF